MVSKHLAVKRTYPILKFSLKKKSMTEFEALDNPAHC